MATTPSTPDPWAALGAQPADASSGNTPQPKSDPWAALGAQPADAAPAPTEDDKAAAQMQTAPPAWARSPGAVPDPGMKKVINPLGAVGASSVDMTPEEKATAQKSLTSELADTPGGKIISTAAQGPLTVGSGMKDVVQGQQDALGGPAYRAKSNAELLRGAGKVIGGGGQTAMLLGAPQLAELGAAAGAGDVAARIGLLKFLAGVESGNIAGEVADKVAERYGFSQDSRNAIATIAQFVPSILGEAAGLHAGVSDIGKDGRGVGVSAFGGKVKAGVGATPEAYGAGVEVNGKRVNVTVPRGGAAEPAGQALPSPSEVTAKTQADSALSAMLNANRARAAAEQISKGVPPDQAVASVQPPTPPQPPKPAGMEQSQLRPDVVSDVAKVISYAPANQRGSLVMEAHENLSKWIVQQGRVLGPDGQVHIVKNPEQAQQLAAKWVNDAVAAHDEVRNQAAQQQAAQPEKPQAEPGEPPQALQPAPAEDPQERLYQRARTLIASNPNASPALLQRNLGISMAQANALVERYKSDEMRASLPTVGSKEEPVVEESRATIDKQIEALQNGTIHTVMIPAGSSYIPPTPEGFVRMDVKKGPGAGTYIYDQKQIQAKTIREAAANGTHGDLLGHVQTKQEVAQAPQAAIVEATHPDGTPIQQSAVAAHPAVIATQAQVLAERHPGAQIVVKHPYDAMAERVQQHADEQAWNELGAQPASEIQHEEEVTENKPEQAGQSETAAPAKYKYGNTQADIPAGSDAAKSLATARGRIDKADLAPSSHGGNDEGLETQPHITLRYGIKGDDTAGIRAFLEKQAPFEAKLGRSDAFPPSESSDGAAPIIAPIESSELHRIEAELDKHGDFIDRTFPEYKPHATIAYVKPEAIEKYKGMTETEGKTFQVRSISISNRDGSTIEVPLRGGASSKVEKGAPLTFTDKNGVERTGTIKHTNALMTRIVDKDGHEHTIQTKKLSGEVEKQQPAKPAAGEESDVRRVPVSEMVLDPKRFQYKLNTNAEGVGQSLTDVKRWNDNLAGVITAWKDPANGKLYVVNGHHRFGLAKRLGVKNLAVRILSSKEFPSAAEARAMGALQNIADGRGTKLDAAKFFRDTGLTPEDLEKRGVSMGEATAADGLALSRLSPKLFDDAVAGKLRINRAVAIGKAAESTEEQEALVKMIDRAEKKGRKVSDDTIEELGRMVHGAGTHTKSQDTLFGAEQQTHSLALEKAEVSAYIRSQIGQEKRLFAGVADEGKATRLGREGNTIDAAHNAEIADKAAQAQELYDRLSTRTGPVNDVLDRAAKSLAEGENQNAVKQRAYEDARAALSETLGGAEGSHVEPAQAHAPASEEANPEERQLSKAELEAAGQNSMFRLAPDVEAIAKQFESRGLDIAVHERGDVITLSKIVVPVAERGKGTGSEFMKALTDYADRTGKDIFATPSADFGASSLGRLTDFYKSFGFRPNRGSRRDFRSTESMVREPVATGGNAAMFRLATATSPFYLKSEKLIEQKMRGPMKGADLLKMLENNGVKPDEIKWTGLGDLAAKDRVTPEEVRQLLDENRVELKDVTKGGAKSIQWKTAPNGDRYSDEGYKIERIPGNGMYRASFQGGESRAVPTESEAEHLVAMWRGNSGEDRSETKYGNYQLPGGENYREMLLTLPHEAPDNVRPTATPEQQQRWDNLATQRRAAFSGGVPTAAVGELDQKMDELHAEMVRDTIARNPARHAKPFTSSHWDEPNILTHIRFNDRTDAEGRKLLHLEEVQSDWHQKGRDKGYRTEIGRATYSVVEDGRNNFSVVNQAGQTVVTGGTREYAEGRAAEFNRNGLPDYLAERDGFGQVPDAPFKKTWHELALRRMLHYAAENGYDGLSWTPGEKQNERYALAKQISELNVFRRHDGSSYDLSAKLKSGGQSDIASRVTPDKLSDWIGKDMAQKILDDQGGQRDHARESNQGGSGTWKTYSGLDLEVGGSGMKGFYDKIVPDYLNKFGRQWGAKVGEADLGSTGYHAVRGEDWNGLESWHVVDDQGNPLPQDTLYRGRQFAEQAAEQRNKDLPGNIGKVPYLPINEAMRKSVTEEGVPLFRREQGTPEQQERAQRLTTSDPKFPYLDRDGIAKLYQKNLQKVLATPDSLTLPGMQDDVAAHTESAREVSAAALKQRGTEDQTAATREMESHSPLFSSSEASPQSSLFRNASDYAPDSDAVRRDWRERMMAKAMPVRAQLGLAKVTRLPTNDAGHSMLRMNGYAYSALRKVVPDLDADWFGVFQPEEARASMIAKLKEAQARDEYQNDTAQRGLAHWIKMVENSTPHGMILLRGDAPIEAIREELGHSWNDRFAFRDIDTAGRVVGKMMNHELFQEAARRLHEMGYTGLNLRGVVDETIAKLLADGDGVGYGLTGWSEDNARSLMSAFLDALEETDPSLAKAALADVPTGIHPTAQRIIDKWRASHDIAERSVRPDGEPKGRNRDEGPGRSDGRAPPEDGKGTLQRRSAETDEGRAERSIVFRRAAEPVRAFLSDAADKTAEARALHEGFYDLESQDSADVLRAIRLVKSVPATATDLATIYHGIEDPKLPLSAEQQQVLDRYIEPIRADAAAIREKLTQGGDQLDLEFPEGQPDTYIHRIVKERGHLLDRLQSGGKGTGAGNKLGVRAGSTKSRTMMAVESSTGERRVVSIKGGRVTAFKSNLPIDMGPIENASKPTSLVGQQWEDKAGREWKITQATTKEIEQHTNLRYHHNALLSTVTDWLELRRHERALDFLHDFTERPDFAKVGVKPEKPSQIPDGWRPTRLPQLRGYYFEPRTQEVIDWYADRQAKGEPNILEKVNDWLTASLFFNPFVHLPNLLNHWAVEKGVSGWANLGAKPSQMRSMIKAIDAVFHRNDDFLKALDAGAPLQSQRFETRHFAETLMSKMADKLEDDRTTLNKIASALGYTNPLKLLDAMKNFSSQVTWYSNDVLFLQSAYEKMAKGMSLETALGETGKHIPDYRLPTRVFDNRLIAKVLDNRLLTAFSAYHYGALKSYGKMLKSIAGVEGDFHTDEKGHAENEAGRTKFGERGHGVDVLAMMALAMGAYAVIDQLLKKVTGDEDADIRRAGSSTLPFNAYRVSTGQMTLTDALQAEVSPGIGMKAFGEIALNRDIRNGKRIYNPGDSWGDIAQEVGGRVAQSFGPANEVQKFNREGLEKESLGLVGVGFHKHGAMRVAQMIASEKAGSAAMTPQQGEMYKARHEALDALHAGDTETAHQIMTEAGMTAKQKRNLTRAAMGDELVERVRSFTIPEVERVMSAATEDEKRRLLPVLRRKMARAHAHLAHRGEDEE